MSISKLKETHGDTGFSRDELHAINVISHWMSATRGAFQRFEQMGFILQEDRLQLALALDSALLRAVARTRQGKRLAQIANEATKDVTP